MKRSILALLLAVFLAVGWLPVSASAEGLDDDSGGAEFVQPVNIYFILKPGDGDAWWSCQVESGDSFSDWYEELPEPERTGYFFDGWSSTLPEFTAFDPDEPIVQFGEQDIYLYGFWTEDTSCTVSFFVDGELYEEITTPDGPFTAADMPRAPEREDLLFKQWQTEEGQPFGGVAEEDISLYASWYDSVITYDPNGNLENSDFGIQQYGVDNGEPTPAYSGELNLESYLFAGWDPEIAETVDGSAAYRAVWEPRPRKTFTLTYNLNTDDAVLGLPEENPEVFTTYDMEVETHVFPVTPVLTRTGFLFAHWNTEPDGSGEIVAPGGPYPVDDGGILYAIWQRETCQVTFEGWPAAECFWGDVLPEASIPTAAMLGLDENGCAERDGRLYRFDGWNTAPDGSGEAFDETCPVKGSLILYPKWTEQIEITFQIENGLWKETGTDCCTVTLDQGSGLEEYLPTAVPLDGFKTDGQWNPAPAGAGEPAVYVFTCDPVAKYTLILQDVEILETRQVTEGEPVGALPVLDSVERNGRTYRFNGWNTAPNGSGAPVDETSTLAGSLTIYPNWVQQVEITFQIQNGLWKENGSGSYSVTLDKGTALEGWIPAALPGDGFKESGKWNANPALAAAYEPTTYVFTCDPRAKYILTLRDGEDSSTMEVWEGLPVGTLPSLTKYGWTFLGWYCGDLPITADAVAEGNMELDARWEQTLSLSFDANGGSNPPKPFTGPGPYTIPVSTPTRLGHLFLGWSTRQGADAPEFKTDDLYTPKGEDTLYAVWEPEEYEITYNDGVKTSVIFEDVVFTAVYGDPTPEFDGKPTRKGYSFKGWKPETAETVTGTALYEAQWAKVDKTNPKTGDHSRILWWTTAMCLAAVTLAGVGIQKKRVTN